MTGDEHKQPAPTGVAAQSQVLGDLQRLACSPGFLYTLAHAAVTNIFIGQEGSSPHEWLSVKELTLVAGLLAIQSVDATSIPDKEALDSQIDRLYTLLARLHQSLWRPMADSVMARVGGKLSNAHEQSDDGIVTLPGLEMVEPFFYVGTGAYDFQYLDLANEKYRDDSDWLESNVGLSMDKLVNTVRVLREFQEQRFADYLQLQTHDERCRAAPATFSFSRNQLSHLTDNEFEAFINKFSIIPGAVKHSLDAIGSVNELEFKPIMRLAEGEFFMLVGFMLAQAIYESPFYWMAGDAHYADQAANHRGSATEEIAYRLLLPIFGDKVYQNVKIANGHQIIHEIDVLAFTGNRAVAIQAKSKRLTTLSRRGDDEQIKKDFTQAVQDAYEQGLASRQCLLGHEHVFTDRDGSLIDLPEHIEDVYVVCLTLDHLPALPFMTQRLLEKKPDNPYQVALSVLDLDILTTYLQSPLDFIHYMYQRSHWSDRIFGTCEAAFLASYLNQGLALPQEVSSAMLAEDMAGLVDADFPTRRGRNRLLRGSLGVDFSSADDRSLTNRWQNSELRQFICLLERSSEPWATDAAFVLLDLSQDVACYFMEKIIVAMNECSRTGDICGCCIVLQGGSGISFVWTRGSSVPLGDVVQNHVAAYKYKHKSDTWLGLGGTLASRDILVAFSREPWQADAELDELARLMLHPELQGKKLGKNQPCWCGSGQKYKKCHV